MLVSGYRNPSPHNHTPTPISRSNDNSSTSNSLPQQQQQQQQQQQHQHPNSNTTTTATNTNTGNNSASLLAQQRSQSLSRPTIGSQSPKRKFPSGDDEDEYDEDEDMPPVAVVDSPLQRPGLRVETANDVLVSSGFLEDGRGGGGGGGGGESPRTKVAERFEGLHVTGRQPGPMALALAPLGGQSPRKKKKKVRRNPEIHGGCDSGRALDREGGLSLELDIPESPTPGVRMFLDTDRDRYTTPPPPPPPPPETETTAMAIDTPPLPSSSSSTSTTTTDNALIDQAALTWREDEITGHDIDTTTPDDDGEGINGVGFRPTPAIAYARSQKRRQQVSEWKAREAREARQRRIEKRRGEVGGGFGGEGTGRRVVRFAGMS